MGFPVKYKHDINIVNSPGGSLVLGGGSMPRIDTKSAFFSQPFGLAHSALTCNMRAAKAIRQRPRGPKQTTTYDCQGQRPRGPKQSTIYDCQEWADLCDEADFWHRRFLEVEAAYCAIRGNVADRCGAVDVHVHSPRGQAVPHEEIVRAVEESHVKQVEFYKEEMEKHYQQYEAALKQGAACNIEVW